jgi:hypothetical protein
VLSSMHHNVTVLERAFQLAKSGKCATVEAIRQQLRSEGYSLSQVTGGVLSRQLLALTHTARGTAMPKGFKGQRRRADVIGNSVKVIRIATVEEAHGVENDGKDPAAKSLLGRRGGEARTQALSLRKRKEIAKAVAQARWGK